MLQTRPMTPRGVLDAQARVPGSKSATNRALPIASVARGVSTISGALASIDTEVMLHALGALGVEVACGEHWRVHGTDGRLCGDVELACRNSGTTLRFLAGMSALANGPVVLDGIEAMRRRPIGPLVHGLNALGVPARATAGFPPVWVGGGGLPGGALTLDGGVSSQFVSALLMVAPYAKRDVFIDFLDGTIVSRPYLDLTLQMMRDFGAEAGWDGDRLWVRAGVRYEARDLAIEPDASSAAYLFAAAAICGGRVEVLGLSATSLQADVRLVDLLERMGCGVERLANSIAVTGTTPLRGLGTVDLNDCPDAVLALAVVAAFAEGSTHIVNVGTLRVKETDRLAALQAELRKLGATVHVGPDWIRITPGELRGASIHTYDDHRMAMAFALAGLRVPGVRIEDPGCVAKTWPGYFDVLEGLK